MESLLARIINEVPPPPVGKPTDNLKLFLVNSWFVNNKNVVCLFYVMNGELKKGMTIKDITDDIIIDPWLPIPCEVLQSMDTKGVKCYQELKLTFKEIDDLVDTTRKTIKTLTDFAQTNRVKIMNAFEGESLVWKEPV